LKEGRKPKYSEKTPDTSYQSGWDLPTRYRPYTHSFDLLFILSFTCFSLLLLFEKKSFIFCKKDESSATLTGEEDQKDKSVARDFSDNHEKSRAQGYSPRHHQEGKDRPLSRAGRGVDFRRATGQFNINISCI
jgi:hypothetical protein